MEYLPLPKHILDYIDDINCIKRCYGRKSNSFVIFIDSINTDKITLDWFLNTLGSERFSSIYEDKKYSANCIHRNLVKDHNTNYNKIILCLHFVNNWLVYNTDYIEYTDSEIFFPIKRDFEIDPSTIMDMLIPTIPDYVKKLSIISVKEQNDFDKVIIDMENPYSKNFEENFMINTYKLYRLPFRQIETKFTIARNYRTQIVPVQNLYEIKNGYYINYNEVIKYNSQL